MKKTLFPKLHLAAIIGAAAVITPLMAFSTGDIGNNKRIEISLAPSASETISITSDSENWVLASVDAMPDSAAAELDQEIVEASDDDINVSETEAEATEESMQPVTESTETEAELSWTTLTVGNGDTLSVLFKNAGYDDVLMYQVLAATKNKDNSIERIYPGQSIAFGADEQGVRQIRVERSELEAVIVDFTASGIEAKKSIRQPEAHLAFVSGTIDSSLFLAGQKAGLPQTAIMELANIFAWDIDFALDIRQGDRFELTYEELFLDGKKIGYGRIMAATFTNDGQTYTGVYYEDNDGDGNYYTPEGDSMRKAFLRTPIDFARISSHFSLNRKHPVLHRIRAHKGTDYAAGTGTPIKATGDGKVILAGRKGGYGNAVVIQHGQGISTLYAHMSKFAKGVRSGSRVRQGQVIGYVGSTGLASGPHLHYEFHVNGVQKNPVTVKLPNAAPVAKAEMIRFKEQTKLSLMQLATLSDSNKVASAH